ncbi:hypothetical protein [Methylobacterium nodulans]|uniref:hypothetical protein n=1 Tax=Methylobacterium nodulans TaxID=114616 RepID=UPI001FCB1D2E|nr:hypothetical protein [Methylobacterium nodulans]
MFKFGAHTPEKVQDEIRDHIKNLAGVSNVGRISPKATKPALRRLWYAEVTDDAAASKLVTKLREQEGIESAELPSQRSLI